MRNSPIRGLNSISPFKTSVILRSDKKDLFQSSPDRLNSNLNDVEYWRLKTKQLEAQLIQINEERILHSRRVEGIADMEDKIDMLLRQNNHIMEENQTLLHFIQQKKAENDALRLQLDAGGVALERETRKANVSLNILDEEHKIQIEKLLSEITRLEDQIQQIQNLKRIQIDGIKSKYETDAIQQIQNLRRSQQGNNQLLELNIRNLKDTIEEKNVQIQRYKKQLKLQAERAAGQSSFLRNQIKKIEQQKQNQFQLYQAQHENNIKNLNQTNRKNQDEIKNLYEIKTRRLGYQIQEKKNEIQENLARFKKTGKQAEQQIASLLEEKAQLRRDIKDSDTLRLKQLQELTSFYDGQLQSQNKNAQTKQENTRKLLEDEIQRLRKIIEAKQAQNQSLMSEIRTLKENQSIKINNLTTQKDDLQKKLKEMIHHYERQIELLKIKTSKLYESDLEALRRQLQNQLSLLASENGKLKESLKQSRDHLVSELEEKVIMRRDYETRLRQMNLKYEREHQQLNQLILMAEKKFENAHSATSIRDIEHTAKSKKQNTSFQTIFAEKRNLQNQIANKNKQIETLNLRIQKMQGHHEKQINDLEKRAAEQNKKYNQSLNVQNNLLKTQVEHQQQLQKKYKELQEKHRQKQKQWNDKMNAKNKELDEKGLKIAKLQGIIEQMQKHHGVLDSKIKVEVGNIQRTNLQMTVLMNEEKERLQKIRQSDKQGIRADFQERMKQLRNQIGDLNSLIQNLRASYEAEKVKSRSLQKQLNDSLKRLDDKGKLEQHVINIGLSNNYFKNVAEIFRKEV